MFNIRELDDYYTINDELYLHNCSLPDNIVRIPNPLFPDPTNIYRSNCIEFWKPVTDKEVPGVDLDRYYISSYGNTWDSWLKRCIHTVCSNGNGFYVQFRLHSRNGGAITVKLHRLILKLFWPVEDPDMYQVNHIDGIHSNNNLYNLEWCNDSYNRMHSIVNGVGTNNFNNQIITLTPEEVHQIKIYRQDMGKSSKEIYFNLMPQIQARGTYDAFRHLIPKIATGRSKLYSQYYC